MFEQEIIEYYNAITPPNEVRTALLAKICRLRKKHAIYKLTFECFASAAACFLFAIIINYTEVSQSAAMPGKWIGTVLTDPSGYLFAVMLFAVLITTFVLIYRKRIAGYGGRQHGDKHE